MVEPHPIVGRRVLRMLHAIAILMVLTTPSIADPTLGLHIRPVPLDALAPVADLDCGRVRTVGDASVRQEIVVFASDVRRIAGARFGLEHDPGVQIEGWTLLTGGDETPDPGWPASGSGNEVRWRGLGMGQGPDELQPIGVITVAAGSQGRVRLAAHPGDERAVVTDEFLLDVEVAARGEVSVSADPDAARSPGAVPCVGLPPSPGTRVLRHPQISYSVVVAAIGEISVDARRQLTCIPIEVERSWRVGRTTFPTRSSCSTAPTWARTGRGSW